MARKISFEVVTSAQLGALKNLAATLDEIAKSGEELSKMGGMTKLENSLKSIDEIAERSLKTLGMTAKQLDKAFGNQGERAARDMETLATRIRDVGKETARVDALRRKSKGYADQMADAELKLAEAKERVAKAETRINAARAKGDTSDIVGAQREYRDAAKAVETAEKAFDSIGKELKQSGQEITDIERHFHDLMGTIAKVRNQAGGKALLEEVISKGDAELFQRMEDSLKSFANVASVAVNPVRRQFEYLNKDLVETRNNFNKIDDNLDSVKNMARQLKELEDLETKRARQGVGSTSTALSGTLKSLRAQTEETVKLIATTSKLEGAERSWAAAENAAHSALSEGNAALKQRSAVMDQYKNALKEASSAESKLVSQQERLEAQQRQLMNTQDDLNKQMRAAQKLQDDSVGNPAAYARATNDMNDLREASLRLNSALDQNELNLRENAAALNSAGAQTKGIRADMALWASTMDDVNAGLKEQEAALKRVETSHMSALLAERTAADKATRKAASDAAKEATRIAKETEKAAVAAAKEADKAAKDSAKAATREFTNMSKIISSVNKTVLSLAASFSGRLRSAIAGVATASRTLLGSGANMFAGIQRALQSTGNMFTSFATRVESSMKRSHAAMMELYAAGFALNMMGQQIQQVGLSGFRTMNQSLQGYMEYEKLRNQAAIAAAEKNPITGEYTVPTALVDQMIKNIQRGTATPEWLQQGGKSLPVAFSAQELAQGMYYYASAIGKNITPSNQKTISDVVTTVMSMARVTNTDVEQAMKGVLNIAMEFGYDARDTSPQGAKSISKIAAQSGYLANISTMEVADIVQMFKMVGPMAHELSGDKAGAGLNETFMMAYLASEVGLRGGNVGRGLNQAFTSMLHPTEKSLGMFNKYFKDVVDEDTFRARFFDEETGTLKGGIVGFMEQLATIDPNKQAQALAELFTTNATRAMIGPLGDITNDPQAMSRFMQEGGIQGFLDRIGGEDPFQWLAAAAAETADSVNGWFTFMQNGWFQFQASIIGSVSGPLKGALRGVGELFFQISDIISGVNGLGGNAGIGQFIATTIAAISGLAAAFGTLMIGSGAMLLVGRSFAVLGGAILPAIRLVFMAIAAFAALTPVLIAIAIAVALVAKAWSSDFMGMSSAWKNFSEGFTFEDTVIPAIKGALDGLMVLGRAFNEFIGLISGDTSQTFGNISQILESVFGPLISRTIINALLNLNYAISGVMDNISNMFSGKNFSLGGLLDIGRAFQGFIEMIILGRTQLANFDAIGRIGDFLGIDDLPTKFFNAAEAVRSGFETIVNVGLQVAQTFANIGRDIWDSLTTIFSGDMFSGLGNLLTGIAQGFVGVFIAIARGVASVLSLLAQFTNHLRTIEGQSRTFMGVTLSLSGAVRALGAAFGAFIALRLVAQFTPLITIGLRLAGVLTSVAGTLIGFGARVVFAAAQIAVMTGALIAQGAVWLAQIAFMTAYNIVAGLVSIFSLAIAMAKGTETAATTTAAGAMIAWTASAIAAGGAGALLLVVTGGLAIAFGAIAIAGMMIAGLFIAIGAAMLIAVVATEGWGAGLSALQSLLSGVWAGMQLAVGVIMLVVGALIAFGKAIGEAVGNGNAFYGIGIMIGAGISLMVAGLVAATAAVITFGVAAAVSWMMALGPIGLVIAGIVLLVAALAGIGVAIGIAMKDLDDLGVNFDSIWTRLAMSALLAGARIADALINGIITGLNALSGSLPDGMSDELSDKIFGGLGINKDAPISWRSNVAGAVEESMAFIGDLQTTVALREPEVEVDEGGWRDALQGALDKLGISDLAESMNIDLDGILSGTTSISDALGILDANNLLDQTNMQMGDLTNEIFKQNKAMEERTKKSQQAFDEARKNAEDYANVEGQFMLNGKLTPRSPYDYSSSLDQLNNMSVELAHNAGVVDSAMDGIAGEIAEESEEFKLAADAFRQAADSLASMSFGDYAKNLFDPLTGNMNGNSLGGFLAGEGGEAILGLFSEDVGPWMNMTELFADLAGSGANFGADLNGQNIHKLLAPNLQLLADQTGLSVDEILGTIPKFFAPEEYFNVATMDMAEGIQGFRAEFGEQMYATFDTLGTDIVDAMGNPMEENGLEWAELNKYAVGKALAGQDWNLADYLSESWGISVQQAEQYLMDHGIDPDAFTEKTYDDLSEAVMSGNGRFNVLTQEWYDWLADATGDFSTKVISMTEEEWGKMSDAQKQIFTNMGYTFVVEDFITPESYNAARDAVQNFADVVAGGQIVAQGTNGVMDGLIAQWTDIGTYVDEETNEVMRVLQDLDGTQVSIPEVEYQGYLASLEVIKKATQDVRDFLAQAGNYANTEGTFDLNGKETAKAPFDYSTSLDFLNQAAQAQKDLEAGQGALKESLAIKAEDLIPATLPADIQAAVAPAITEALRTGVTNADISGAIESEFVGLGSNISLNLTAKFASEGRLAGLAFKNALNATIAGPATMPTMATPASPAVAAGAQDAGRGGGMGVAAPAAQQIMKIKVDLDTSAADSKLADLTLKISSVVGSEGSAPRVITIGAVTEVASSKIEDIRTKLQYLGTGQWPITLTMNANNGTIMETLNQIQEKLTALTSGGAEGGGNQIFVSLVAGSAFPILNDLSQKLTYLSTGSWPISVTVPDFALAAQNLADIKTLADAIVNTYSATVSVIGYAYAVSLLTQVRQAAENIEGNYAATVTVLAEGALFTLQSISGALNAIDGRNAFSTVTVVNRTVNEVVSSNRPGIGYAKGGFVNTGPIQLVGEKGPELVSLPMGSYVYTASETEQMMANSLGSSNVSNAFSQDSGRRESTSETHIDTINSGDTYNFYGDMHFGSREDARTFFADIDKMTGKKVAMNNRGQGGGIDDSRLW